MANGGGPPPSVPNPAASVTITPVFKLVFLSVLLLTLLCLGISVYISLQGVTQAAQNLNEKLLAVFNLGCGAIIGLLGGKSLT